MSVSSISRSYRFYVALDGNGLNGLEGYAGVCLFSYDPDRQKYNLSVRYFDGAAGGHAVSINPDRTLGFLGTTGQQLVFFDPLSLDEVQRFSTLRMESTDASIKGSTHVAWLDSFRFITAIGEHFYEGDVRSLEKLQQLGPHGVKIPHTLHLSSSKRFLVYGSMDHPERGEAREVGIFDLAHGTVRTVPLPATCWHVSVHPDKDIAWAPSFRVLPGSGGDYHRWAIASFKEYLFEIDVASASVVRHWVCSAEENAHINSDITVTEREIVYCNGASQSIVCVSRDSLAEYRVIDQRPTLLEWLARPRELARQTLDVLSRGSPLEHLHDILVAARSTRYAVLDSVYACQISRDQSLVFTGNRGLNRIEVRRYPDFSLQTRCALPGLRTYRPRLSRWADPRVGLHHGHLVSPEAS